MASRMRDGVEALSEREKETLRLLLGGHDAKSISRDLGLSVHTVNERLRDARRKLGVSSSREAARVLADVEQHAPNSLVDKQLGVADAAATVAPDGQPDRLRGAGYPLAWFGGGMIIMSLIIASLALSAAFHSGADTHISAAPTTAAPTSSSNEAGTAGASAARAWVALLDEARWADSWNAAGTAFKTQLPAARWASIVEAVRTPLGPVSSRVFRDANETNSLPGAPDGNYRIIEFATSFEKKHDAVETVVLAAEGSGWKVDGYVIR